MVAKAKAVQEMIEIVTGKHFRENVEVSMKEMLRTVGIDMIYDSHFLFMMVTAK